MTRWREKRNFKTRKLAQAPGLTWIEANNAIYGPGGPKESRQIDRFIDSLPEPAVGPRRREYSGKFNVRVPKSLHASLASEAEAEGVSLNQLVVTKLALHLQPH